MVDGLRDIHPKLKIMPVVARCSGRHSRGFEGERGLAVVGGFLALRKGSEVEDDVIDADGGDKDARFGDAQVENGGCLAVVQL